MASNDRVQSDGDVVQLFRPPNADPLATRVEISPYIENICGYLPLSGANLYRTLIRSFEDEFISEETLALMIRKSLALENYPNISLLHDDLILVIMLNKVEVDLHTMPAPAVMSLTSGPVQQLSSQQSTPSVASSSNVQNDRALTERAKVRSIWTNGP